MFGLVNSPPWLDSRKPQDFRIEAASAVVASE
jgi:hypothetical protein